MSATRTRAHRLADRAVIGLFLLLIGLPFAGTLLGLDLMPGGNDLRRRAAFPKFNEGLLSIRKFPRAFEEWFDDHFGFRGPLIRALTTTKVRGLGVSTSFEVLLGRDGWLFYNHQQIGADYDEVRPFTAQELERWRLALETRQRWLRQHGSDYILFLPPNKQTIYPEYLDPHLKPRQASVRLGQLVDYLHQHSTVTVIDVRQQLQEARQHERLYNITDSHWNDRGAFVGYRALAEELVRRFPKSTPFKRSQFEETEHDDRGGDLAGLLDQRNVYREHCLGLKPRFGWRARTSEVPVLYDKTKVKLNFGRPFALEPGDTSLPRCVLLHDSFALALVPMLAEHFQRLAAVWHDGFHRHIILNERPDIVIQELLERKLGFVLPTAFDD
jgi:hypothetical protein